MNTDAEVIAYVEQELNRAVPDGWQWSRQESGLRWQIEATSARKYAPLEDYWLHVSADLEWVSIFYGNTDLGALSLSTELLNAKVIRTESLQAFSLSTVVGEVMLTCDRNYWGLT